MPVCMFNAERKIVTHPPQENFVRIGNSLRHRKFIKQYSTTYSQIMRLYIKDYVV